MCIGVQENLPRVVFGVDAEPKQVQPVPADQDVHVSLSVQFFVWIVAMWRSILLTTIFPFAAAVRSTGLGFRRCVIDTTRSKFGRSALKGSSGSKRKFRVSFAAEPEVTMIDNLKNDAKKNDFYSGMMVECDVCEEILPRPLLNFETRRPPLIKCAHCQAVQGKLSLNVPSASLEIARQWRWRWNAALGDIVYHRLADGFDQYEAYPGCPSVAEARLQKFRYNLAQKRLQVESRLSSQHRRVGQFPQSAQVSAENRQREVERCFTCKDFCTGFTRAEDAQMRRHRRPQHAKGQQDSVWNFVENKKQ